LKHFKVIQNSAVFEIHVGEQRRTCSYEREQTRPYSQGGERRQHRGAVAPPCVEIQRRVEGQMDERRERKPSDEEGREKDL
jgi:hypothetical protein